MRWKRSLVCRITEGHIQLVFQLTLGYPLIFPFFLAGYFKFVLPAKWASFQYLRRGLVGVCRKLKQLSRQCHSMAHSTLPSTCHSICPWAVPVAAGAAAAGAGAAAAVCRSSCVVCRLMFWLKGILMILINCMFARNYNGNNAIMSLVRAINNAWGQSRGGAVQGEEGTPAWTTAQGLGFCLWPRDTHLSWHNNYMHTGNTSAPLYHRTSPPITERRKGRVGMGTG